MMCICISIKYVFVDLYETAPLIDKYVNKMKSIVDMAMITYFYNKLKQLGMMTMTLYAIV